MTYDRVLLDLDGTVYVGERVVPGAAEAIGRLRAAGVRLAFVSNDPVRSAADFVIRLGSIGIAAAEREIVTCADATASLIAVEQQGARVLALGSPAWSAAHRSAGLELVEDGAAANVVSLGGDPSFGYRELELSIRAVIGGAVLYGSSRDATFPAADGPSPGAGTLIAAVEYGSGAVARCAGKPESAMFEEARRRLGAGRYVMVGDRLDADIAGAAAVGIETVLVLTGSTGEAELRAWTGAAPTRVVESIASM